MSRGLKTIRKLSNRKLDHLQDRLGDKYWAKVDVAPQKYCENQARRLNVLVNKIGNERLRRLGL